MSVVSNGSIGVATGAPGLPPSVALKLDPPPPCGP